MTYMIVTTEQMVARNPEVTPILKQWTFSQTLALIMLGQQIMDCVSYFKESRRISNEERRSDGGVSP